MDAIYTIWAARLDRSKSECSIRYTEIYARMNPGKKLRLGEDTHAKIRNTVTKLRNLEITLSLVNDLDRVLTYFGYNVKDIDFNQVEVSGGRFCIKDKLINARVVYSTLPTKAKDGSPLETDGVILQGCPHSLSVCIGSTSGYHDRCRLLKFAWPHDRKENCNPGLSNQLYSFGRA